MLRKIVYTLLIAQLQYLLWQPHTISSTVCLSVCLSVFLSIWLAVYLFFFLAFFFSVCQSLNVTLSVSRELFIYRSLRIFLLVYLSSMHKSRLSYRRHTNTRPSYVNTLAVAYTRSHTQINPHIHTHASPSKSGNNVPLAVFHIFVRIPSISLEIHFFLRFADVWHCGNRQTWPRKNFRRQSRLDATNDARIYALIESTCEAVVVTIEYYKE